MVNAFFIYQVTVPFKIFYWDIGQAGPNQELESEVKKKKTVQHSLQVIFDIISHIHRFLIFILLLLQGCQCIFTFNDEEIQQAPSRRYPVCLLF